MVKRLQNKVAESRLTLPGVAVFVFVVWLLCGLVSGQWWVQFGCFALSTYLMVELNNTNALIRIYSRMVSCTFLMLGCCACFLFPSLKGAILQLFFISSILVLFLGYQDKQSVGTSYYSFLLISIGSMVFAQILFFVPLLWLLMLTHIQSMSWRTMGASLFGLMTPYWFGACWLAYKNDFTPLVSHFQQLSVFQFPFDYTTLPTHLLAVFVFFIVVIAIGITHYIRKHHGDKIRIRLLYGFFAWTDIFAIIFLALQPQHYDSLLRIITVCTAPLFGHFVALTSTKATNIVFCIIVGIMFLLTGYSLWTVSSLF